MKKGQEAMRMIKILSVLIVAIIAISTLFGAIAVIAAGHRGVLLTWGKVEDKILPEGISIVTPYMNQVVQMSAQTLKYQASASSASKDLQDVSTEVTLNYKIEPERANWIYQNLGLDYENRIIQPAIQEAVKASTAQFTAEELITQRPTVKANIESALRDRMLNYSLVMETVSITDFKFSPSFSQAIESKVTAQQLALKAENDLARIKIEAQQTIESAKGLAESIRIQGQALHDNPQLVSLKWTERWNGILPATLIVGGDTPTLLLPINPINPVNP